MQRLKLPAVELLVKSIGKTQKVFDPVRKKYVALTPEEHVRQHILNYLIKHKNYPASLMVVEHTLRWNKMTHRSDILVYDKKTCPSLIVECKAPTIAITQSVFDQIARYNITLKVPYLLVTNGVEHFCCKIDYQQGSFTFLSGIPDYDSL